MKGRKKQAAAWLVIASLLVCITGEHAPAGRALAAQAAPGSLSLEGEGRTPEEERWLQDIPFYYDEHMEKVYDYETFPERYYGVEPAIAGVDDVALLAVVAIGCVLGAFGIQMASEDIGTFLVGSFKPWLEKKHPDKMSDFEIFLTGGAITISEWVPLLGEFLNGEEVSVKDTGIEYKPAAAPAKPYFSDRVIEGETFLRTFTEVKTSSSYTIIRDYYFDSSLDILCFYVGSSTQGEPLRYSLELYCQAGDTYKGAGFIYYYNRLLDEGYFEYSRSQRTLSSTMLIYASDVGSISDYPVFVNSAAARSYIVYGTTGGMINNQASSIIKTGASLLKDNLQFHERHLYAENLSLPADEAGLQSVASSLDSAETYEELMEVVERYWQTSPKKAELTDAVCYSNLQYIVRVLSRYAGTAITDEEIDAFIRHFYETSTDGTSALAEEQAGEIVRQFVVINGGGQEPDDDKNKNQYVVVKRLAAALGLFLVSAGLVSDAPVFEGGQTIENIELAGSSSELPAPDPDPPSPHPGVDLSGILDLLRKILELLTAWADPAGLIKRMADQLSLPGLFASLVSAVQEIPGLINGELSLPRLFSDLAAELLALPEPLLEPISGIAQAVWELQAFLSDAIPSPAQIAQAVEDVVIGTDDPDYRLEQSVIDKFPFCIPFDLIRCFRVLQADPVEPVWHVPLLIDHPAFHLEEELVLDLTLFEQPIAVIRFFLLFAFILGLILATRQLIRG